MTTPAEPIFTPALEKMWARMPEHVRINDAEQEIPLPFSSEGLALNVALNPSFEAGTATYWVTIPEPPDEEPPTEPPSGSSGGVPSNTTFPGSNQYPGAVSGGGGGGMMGGGFPTEGTFPDTDIFPEG